jgi:hypothetical protein
MSPQLTSHKQRRGIQCPMFRLKPFHQRRQGDKIDDHVQEAHVYKGKGIEPVHCQIQLSQCNSFV